MSHVYLSVGRRLNPLQASAPLINPRNGHPTKQMRYRGELGAKDDPQGFKRMMERRGHVVEIHDEIVGRLNEVSGHIEYELT